MTMTVKKMGYGKTLMVATALAAMSLGFAGSAKADLDTYAVLELSNINFVGLAPNGDVILLDFQNQIPNNFSASTNAFLDAAAPGFDTHSDAFPSDPVDPLMACVDGSGGNGATCATFGENNFNRAGAQQLFTRTDTIAQGNLFQGTGAVSSVGEIKIDAAGVTAAASTAAVDVTSVIVLETQALIEAGTRLDLSFDAALFADLDLLLGMSGGSQVNTTARIVVTDSSGAQVALWSPDTQAIGFESITQPCNLNDQANVTNVTPSNGFDCDSIPNNGMQDAPTFFSFTTNPLNETDLYTIQIDIDVVVSGRLDPDIPVPEPSALLLMGVGLLGLGAVARRRKVRA